MENIKIPTAEEYLKEIGLLEVMSTKDLIHFAKLHVKAALDAAADNAEKNSPRIYGEGIGGMTEYPVVDGRTILSAYPEENIK